MKNLRRLFVMGGMIVLIGAGCTTVTTESQVSDASENATEAFSNSTDDSNTNFVEDPTKLEHPGVLDAEKIENKQVRIKTNKGDIVFKVYPETAPLAVSNFVFLAEQGYYDGLTWHRVVEDFVIQGGDPFGDGSGGPGYRFADEIGPDHVPEDLLIRMDKDENKSLYQHGIVAMANAGPDTNGSQFFIMLSNIPSDAMPNLYSIFGEVTEGLGVVDKIEQGDIMEKVTVEELGA